MIRIYKILAIAILCVLIPAFMSLQNENKESYFKIEVAQNGEIILPKNGIISLEKKPFKFIVSMHNTDNVTVSSSWGKYYYDYPSDKNIFHCEDDQEFKDCRFVAVKTGNQDHFNVDKDLAVGDGGYQWNWFYSASIDWHRFDKGVKKENGVIYAEMTVKNIFDCDGRDARKEKSDYKYTIDKVENDIYMVFATSKYEKGMSEPEELQRTKFTLKFKD